MQEKEQSNSPVKQRILQFAGTLGISKRDFYSKIGVSRGTLESKTGITEDVVTKFFATYPEVSVSWVMTGEGEMLDISPLCKKKNKENSSDNEITLQKAPEGSQEGIPLIPLSAMAGVFTGETTVMDYECERYVVPAFKGSDFLIRVLGASMHPTYQSGDLVACQRVPLAGIFFQWGKTYVIDTDQGAIIKRIRPGHDDDHLLIVSDNAEAYPPFELHRSRLHGIALVRGIIRLE